jgi:hypothetical protein
MIELTTVDRYYAMFPDTASASGTTSAPGKPEKKLPVEMRIKSISAKVQKYLGRSIEVGDFIERFTPDKGSGTKRIQLSSFPISAVSKVTAYGVEIESGDYGYTAYLHSGVILFYEPILQQSCGYADAISVEYTGGMAEDTEDFIEKYPDIESLILDQVYFEINRVVTIANKSIGGNISSAQLNEYGLLPALVNELSRYRTVSAV